MRLLIALLALPALAACAVVPRSAPSQDQFYARLRALCGQAFEGRVVTADAADSEMAAARLVVQFRACSDGELRIPFHVGNDHSRTWVISRTANGLRLSHEHHPQDGSVASVTDYGGETIAPGNPRRQEFPADQASRDLFVARTSPHRSPMSGRSRSCPAISSLMSCGAPAASSAPNSISLARPPPRRRPGASAEEVARLTC